MSHWSFREAAELKVEQRLDDSVNYSYTQEVEALSRELVMLQTSDGEIPFEDWLNGIKSNILESAVLARLSRVEDGNFGDHKSVGEGVYELRIPKGPGLRVYYGLDGPKIVILIGGGDKSTQSKDIKKAQILLKEYFNEK